jgi:hypothetical protein
MSASMDMWVREEHPRNRGTRGRCRPWRIERSDVYGVVRACSRFVELCDMKDKGYLWITDESIFLGARNVTEKVEKLVRMDIQMAEQAQSGRVNCPVGAIMESLRPLLMELGKSDGPEILCVCGVQRSG